MKGKSTSGRRLAERNLGVGIAGLGAGELIREGVFAIEMGATAKDLAECIHPHPTLSETLMKCAEAFYGYAALKNMTRYSRPLNPIHLSITR